MITTPVLLLLLTAQTAPPPPPPPSNSGTEQVIGPDKGGVDDALGRAATRPLRDLNVMKPKIEQDLANIMANPYAVKSLRTCRQLNAENRGMTCAGFESPGFGSLDEISRDEIIACINASKAEFLLVALGAKKGQAWARSSAKRITRRATRKQRQPSSRRRH